MLAMWSRVQSVEKKCLLIPFTAVEELKVQDNYLGDINA